MTDNHTKYDITLNVNLPRIGEVRKSGKDLRIVTGFSGSFLPEYMRIIEAKHVDGDVLEFDTIPEFVRYRYIEGRVFDNFIEQARTDLREFAKDHGALTDEIAYDTFIESGKRYFNGYRRSMRIDEFIKSDLVGIPAICGDPNKMSEHEIILESWREVLMIPQVEKALADYLDNKL